MLKRSLSVSIVIYKPNIDILKNTLISFFKASKEIELNDLKIYLINNSINYKKKDIQNLCDLFNLILINAKKNYGYGKGHNLVLKKILTYHLILNPDVIIEKNALKNGIEYFEKDKNIGLITPNASDPDNNIQYLIYNYPSAFIYFLRGIAPIFIKKIFKKKLDDYILKHQYNKEFNQEIRITSGCFMFFRGDILTNISGFDERFFLYLEDFDISIRASKISKIKYYPNIKIIHYGGNTPNKPFIIWLYFIASCIKFFNKNGWKFY